jgi:hypothetical protein
MNLLGLKRLFREIEQEAADNPSFRARLQAALQDETVALAVQQPDRDRKSLPRNRRMPAALDPLQAIVSVGEEGLRRQLEPLTSDQLKDIISEFGMDPARLAMKWANRERLREHVVSTANARSKKGDAFRT